MVAVLGFLLVIITCLVLLGFPIWFMEVVIDYDDRLSPSLWISIPAPLIVVGCLWAIFISPLVSGANNTSAKNVASGRSHTIYMYLPDEAVDIWRPVQAEKIGTDLYRVLGPLFREREVWQFAPGSIVQVEMKRLAGGDFPVAVAVRLSAIE